MEPARIDFNIQHGVDWRQPLLWTGGGVPVDLSGYTGLMQIRPVIDSPRVLAELSTENGALLLGGLDGTVTLVLTEQQTRSQWWTSGVYDLDLRTASGYRIRLARGLITVVRSVTRELVP